MLNLTRTVEIMERAAIEAAVALSKMQPKTRRLAARKDFLTDADLKSERIILDTLANEYPNIPAYSEEAGGKEVAEGYLWVIDPIDGTINFFLQDDNWGISIALVENGQTIAGVVYLPARRQMFFASLDISTRFRFVGAEEGIWIKPFVNQENNLLDSQFWIGWGKEEHNGEDHKKVYDVIAKLDRHTLYPQIRNSAVADIMAVVCGKICGYVLLKPEPFDVAAAGFILERAGGMVTDSEGSTWNPFSRSFVGSNGVIHEDLLRIIK